jgi:glycerol-3-phosphate acyltransferase PlsY
VTGPLATLVPIAIGYGSGSLPWGLWLGRALRGVDVRTLGSGNLGATNVYRSLGPGIGITTLALDMAKGALPVWLVPGSALGTGFPAGAEWCRVAVGLAAIAGHMWTMFAGFKGGKGVATTAGVLLALSPPAFGVFVAVFVGAVALTRYISVGSMLGALAFALTLGLTRGFSHPAAIFGTVVTVLVILRHRENIGRLLKGQERRFSFRPSAAGQGS